MLRNLSRLKKELKLLTESPGPGVSAVPVDGNILELLASIVGPEESPYAAGTFQLTLTVPENYPFEPPKAQFITPIYHPNIDTEGRICLDTLKPQPQGSWAPSITLNTLLLSIRLLLMHPNADDGLVPDITELFRRDHAMYKNNAMQHTLKFAILHGSKSSDVDIGGGSGSGSGSESKSSADADTNVASSGDNMSVHVSDTTKSESTTSGAGDAINATFVGTSHSTATTNIADSGTYTFVSEGYTLIGCVPGCIGEVLHVSAVDDGNVGSGDDDGGEDGGNGGGKRQRVA